MADNNAHGDILIRLKSRYISLKFTPLGAIYQVSINVNTKSFGIREL